MILADDEDMLESDAQLNISCRRLKKATWLNCVQERVQRECFYFLRLKTFLII